MTHEHHLVFDPVAFAHAYAACRVLASTDDARPALMGTHVEVFDDGVRLVATDSYALITTWVGYRGTDGAAPPPLGEMPGDRFTLTGGDLLGQVAKHAKKDAAALAREGLQTPAMTLRTGVKASEGTLAGLAQPVGNLSYAGELLATTPLLEGDYPDWRRLAARDPSAAETVTLSTELLRRVATAAALVGNVTRLDTAGELGSLRWVVDAMWDNGEIVKPGALILMMPVRDTL
jgi:hypothetical protein